MSDRSLTAVVLPLPRRYRAAPARVTLWAMLSAAWRRHRTRHSLAQLDAYLLRDIGITYADAEAEVNKPFWMR